MQNSLNILTYNNFSSNNQIFNFTNTSLTQTQNLTQIQKFPDLNTFSDLNNIINSNISSTSQQKPDNNNNILSWKNIRKIIGIYVPIVTTLFLAIASLLGGAPFLERISKPMSKVLNSACLLIVASDLPSIFKEIIESLDKAKKIIAEPSLKGIVYIVSKIIPLLFLGEVFKKALKPETNKDRLFLKFTRVCGRTKSQLVNLGGDSLIRSIIWFFRRKLVTLFICRLPFYKFLANDKMTPALTILMESLSRLWLDFDSELLPRRQFK